MYISANALTCAVLDDDVDLQWEGMSTFSYPTNIDYLILTKVYAKYLENGALEWTDFLATLNI